MGHKVLKLSECVMREFSRSVLFFQITCRDRGPTASARERERGEPGFKIPNWNPARLLLESRSNGSDDRHILAHSAPDSYQLFGLAALVQSSASAFANNNDFSTKDECFRKSMEVILTRNIKFFGLEIFQM